MVPCAEDLPIDGVLHRACPWVDLQEEAGTCPDPVGVDPEAVVEIWLLAETWVVPEITWDLGEGVEVAVMEALRNLVGEVAVPLGETLLLGARTKDPQEVLGEIRGVEEVEAPGVKEVETKWVEEAHGVTKGV